MTDKHTPEIEKVCPVCRRPMILLHEIRRAFAEDLYVFKCQPCGFSMTEPASWSARKMRAPLVNYGAGSVHLRSERVLKAVAH
jgi:hypothetical protein